MNTTNTKPISTIRDGSLKATIWKNTGDNGDYYSVKFSRTWRDEKGNFHDSESFSGSELLRIARLADLAYAESLVYRKADQQDEGR